MRILVRVGVDFYQLLFMHLLKIISWFFSFSVKIILFDFRMLSQFCVPGINNTLLLDKFANICLGFYVYIYEMSFRYLWE